MAGFKFKRFSWAGGTLDTSPNNEGNLCVWYLKELVNNIIATNTGWQLDTDKNISLDNLAFDATNYVTFCFLKSKSGSKLLIGYKSRGMHYDNTFVLGDTSKSYNSDLFMSIIPASSQSTFGNTWMKPDFIPTDATKLVFYSSISNITYANSFNNTHLGENRKSATYKTAILTDGDILLIREYHDAYLGATYAIGPIIKTLAYKALDTLPTAMYGVLRFGAKNVIAAEPFGIPSEYYETRPLGNNTYTYYSTPASAASTTYSYNNSEIFAADGTHLSDSSSTRIAVIVNSGMLVDNMCNADLSGVARWSAVGIGVISTDPTKYCVVKGDGFKGYIDTNFMRVVLPKGLQANQLVDDGNFIYYNCGLLFGWDPSNEGQLV